MTSIASGVFKSAIYPRGSAIIPGSCNLRKYMGNPMARPTTPGFSNTVFKLSLAPPLIML